MEKHPLENLMEIYLSEQRFSPATIKSYRISFKHFIMYLREHGIVYPTTRDVIGYREYKRSLGNSSHYLHIQITALRGLYRYLKTHQKGLNLPDRYAHDIMIPVKNEKIHYHLNKPVLSLEQARILILETKTKRKYLWHYRDHAIIYVMLTSGLRAHEIVDLRIEDYQLSEGQKVLYLRKEDAFDPEHVVQLAKGTIAALDEYLEKRHDDHPHLFISHKQVSNDGKLSRMFFRDMFLRLRKIPGLEMCHLTPHALRHSAAIFHLLRGASLVETKAFMRHQMIGSTLIYQDYLKRLEDETEAKLDVFILREDGVFDEWKDFMLLLE